MIATENKRPTYSIGIVRLFADWLDKRSIASGGAYASAIYSPGKRIESACLCAAL
jgi:hypothetical protein